MPRIKAMFESVATTQRQPSVLLEKLVRAGSLSAFKTDAETEAATTELEGGKPPGTSLASPTTSASVIASVSAPLGTPEAGTDLAGAVAELKCVSVAEQQVLNWPRIVQTYHGPPGVLETIGPPNHPIDLARMLQRLGQWNVRTMIEWGNPDIGLTLLWTRVIAADARVILAPLAGLELPAAKRELLPHLPRPHQQLKVLRITSDAQAMEKLLDDAIEGRKVDFVFLHGRRPFKELSADFRKLRKRVRADGLIAWDGINPITKTDQTDGGDKLWTEVRPLYPSRAEYLNGVVNEAGGIAMIKI